MQRKAEQIFKQAVKGKNLMTNYIIKYYMSPDEKIVIELSEGTGIFTPMLYGVIVVQNGKQQTNLSQCFTEKSVAINYAKKLIE